MQHIRFNRCLLKTEPEHTSQFPDRNSDVFRFIKLSSVLFVKNIELLPIFTLLFSDADMSGALSSRVVFFPTSLCGNIKRFN